MNMVSSLSSITPQRANPPLRNDCRALRRPIPDRVLIGYATTCDDRIAKAVEQGVNVVVWAFLSLKPESESTKAGMKAETSLDLDCVKEMIDKLDAAGYDDTLHLVSFGGWSGGHLHINDIYTADVWYRNWVDQVGHIFHGMDWDLEGTDNLQSETNVLTIPCLDAMGLISEMAHADGYAVTMAPAQSYLDVDSQRFSRYLNLTDPGRGPWHGTDFPHFGANAYAYILAKFGSDVVDLISIQYYESYSRAAMRVFADGVEPGAYLVEYNRQLAEADERYLVNFSDDESIADFLPSQKVSVPLSKVVWGFANGWALDHPEQKKVVFFSSEEIGKAYSELSKDGIAPRGMMFWLIDGEGSNGVRYVPSLNDILHIRNEGGGDSVSDIQ